jgi:Domain of unknown function DUF11
MVHRSLKKSFHLFFISALAMALAISVASVSTAYADTSTSDLAIELLAAPKNAKACEVFEATFRISNLGPDDASGIFVNTSVPDQLGTLDLLGVPESLAAGESVIITAVVKVVSFGPNDTRDAWIGAGVSSDPYPNTSVDPNWENNNASRYLKLVGKPNPLCP